MKKIFITLAILVVSASSYCQNIMITDLSTTIVNGGINVNVKTISGTGSGYLSHDYTITGNIIDLSVCYWFDDTLPILEFDNDFLIPLSSNGSYTINVHIILSSSQITCDNFANTDNETIEVEYTLSTTEYELTKRDYALFPNPTNGITQFTGNKLLIKQIDVFDELGRLIKHLKTTNGKSIDFNELQNGIYFVKIYTDKGNLHQKIILEK